MDPAFAWIEASALSQWLRSDPSLLAFPGVLVIHALGMALFAGTGLMVSLQSLGLAPGISPKSLGGFMPVLWFGLALSIASGLLLVAAYPTKALTNPVFYVKIAALILAATVVARLRIRAQPGRPVAPPPARPTAIVLLLCLIGVIATGRLLAYTYSRLTVDLVRMI